METTSVASSSEKRRRRPPLACVACRRRKIRCDRRVPCQNCVKAHRATSCTYVPDDRLDPRAVGTQDAQAGAIERGSGRAGDDDGNASPGSGLSLRSHSGATAPRPSNIQNATSRSTDAEATAMAERVRQLELQLKQVLEAKTTGLAGTTSAELLQQHADPAALDSTGDGHCKVNAGPRRVRGNEPFNDGTVGSSGPRAVLTKSRYMGGSHWMHGINLLPRRNTLFLFLEGLKSDKTSEAYQAIAASKSLGKSIKSARVPHVSSLDFGQHMPSQEIANQLLEAYFRTFEKLYRVIHIPSFRLEHGRYWQNPKAASQAFVIQLQLCMALGTLVQDDKYSMRKHAMRWIYEARLWLLQPSKKSRTDLSGLQIWCLVHLACGFCGVDTDLVWVSAGTLLRIAMYTGLHRDPEHLPKMSLLLAETRRRLWVTVLEILVESSMESGAPPLVTMDDFDTKPPGHYNDEDLLGDDAATQIQSPRPLTTFTDTSVQIALFHSIDVRLKIATYLNEFRSVPTYEKTLGFNSDLTSASRNLDALMAIYQSQEPGLSVFQLAATEHTVQRYFLALHLPWLGLAKEDPRYYFSRKTCIEIALRNQKEGQAHGFLGAESGHDPDDFGRLLICALGGFRYIGTQCLLVLVVELLWQLEEHRTTFRNFGASASGPSAAPTGASPARTPGMGFGLLSSPMSQPSETLDYVLQASNWMRTRIKAGEMNLKSYLFAAAMYAEVAGLQKGLSDAELTLQVRNAVTEAAKTSSNILRERYAMEVGDDAQETAVRTAERTSDAVASRFMSTNEMQVPEMVGQYLSMDPGSSGSLSDWGWDALGDPDCNFNLNLGAMDLLFGDGGI